MRLPVCTCPHQTTLPALVLGLLASGLVGFYAASLAAGLAAALVFQLVDHWIGRVAER